MFKLSALTNNIVLKPEKKNTATSLSFFLLKKSSRAVLNICKINGSKGNWNGKSLVEDRYTVTLHSVILECLMSLAPLIKQIGGV